VLSHRSTYRINPNFDGKDPATYPDPLDPTMPTAIQQLGPREVVVQDDFVRLIFYPGGAHHVDVVGFREGADEVKWAAFIGKGQRLTPGLWYYEDVNE
jgi:hypothetical protein